MISDTGPNETMAPSPLLYFAYGSNMCTARLRERTPSCRPIGLATLEGYELRFHKRSGDGSGKCNAFAGQPTSSVIGVLFELDPAERADLDDAEGVDNGYEHATVVVLDHLGREREALTYLASASHIDESLSPYEWYKNFVLEGAREHALAEDYVSVRIASVATTPDPDLARERRQRAKLEHFRRTMT